MGVFEIAIGFVLGSAGGVMFPALIYVIAVLITARILIWGTVGVEVVNGTKVLKLPGGGLLASLPFPELILLGVALLNPAVNLSNPLMALVLLGLSAFALIRFSAWLVTHLFAFFVSLSARRAALDFSIECMDDRCEHGLRGNGNHLHNWACGGYTLLTALGFAPLVVIPVLFGLPAGIWGIIAFIFACFPYQFVISKVLAKRFGDSAQVFFKGLTDLIMFATEFPGWLIGSLTLSIVSWRPMWPKVSKTRLH